MKDTLTIITLFFLTLPALSQEIKFLSKEHELACTGSIRFKSRDKLSQISCSEKDQANELSKLLNNSSSILKQFSGKTFRQICLSLRKKKKNIDSVVLLIDGQSYAISRCHCSLFNIKEKAYCDPDFVAKVTNEKNINDLSSNILDSAIDKTLKSSHEFKSRFGIETSCKLQLPTNCSISFEEKELLENKIYLANNQAIEKNLVLEQPENEFFYKEFKEYRDRIAKQGGIEKHLLPDLINSFRFCNFENVTPLQGDNKKLEELMSYIKTHPFLKTFKCSDSARTANKLFKKLIVDIFDEKNLLKPPAMIFNNNLKLKLERNCEIQSDLIQRKCSPTSLDSVLNLYDSGLFKALNDIPSESRNIWNAFSCFNGKKEKPNFREILDFEIDFEDKLINNQKDHIVDTSDNERSSEISVETSEVVEATVREVQDKARNGEITESDRATINRIESELEEMVGFEFDIYKDSPSFVSSKFLELDKQKTYDLFQSDMIKANQRLKYIASNYDKASPELKQQFDSELIGIQKKITSYQKKGLPVSGISNDFKKIAKKLKSKDSSNQKAAVATAPTTYLQRPTINQSTPVQVQNFNNFKTAPVVQNHQVLTPIVNNSTDDVPKAVEEVFSNQASSSVSTDQRNSNNSNSPSASQASSVNSPAKRGLTFAGPSFTDSSVQTYTVKAPEMVDEVVDSDNDVLLKAVFVEEEKIMKVFEKTNGHYSLMKEYTASEFKENFEKFDSKIQKDGSEFFKRFELAELNRILNK